MLNRSRKSKRFNDKLSNRSNSINVFLLLLILLAITIVKSSKPETEKKVEEGPGREVYEYYIYHRLWINPNIDSKNYSNRSKVWNEDWKSRGNLKIERLMRGSNEDDEDQRYYVVSEFRRTNEVDGVSSGENFSEVMDLVKFFDEFGSLPEYQLKVLPRDHLRSSSSDSSKELESFGSFSLCDFILNKSSKRGKLKEYLNLWIEESSTSKRSIEIVGLNWGLQETNGKDPSTKDEILKTLYDKDKFKDPIIIRSCQVLDQKSSSNTTSSGKELLEIQNYLKASFENFKDWNSNVKIRKPQTLTEPILRHYEIKEQKKKKNLKKRSKGKVNEFEEIEEEEEEEKSFLSKYWMYILPFLVISLINSGPPPQPTPNEENNGGSSSGDGNDLNVRKE